MANGETLVALELRDAWQQCSQAIEKKMEATGIRALLELCNEKLPSITGPLEVCCKE